MTKLTGIEIDKLSSPESSQEQVGAKSFDKWFTSSYPSASQNEQTIAFYAWLASIENNPPSRWVICSERLPSDPSDHTPSWKKTFLCQIIRDGKTLLNYVIYSGNGFWAVSSLENVLAWFEIPLVPTPPLIESEDEKGLKKALESTQFSTAETQRAVDFSAGFMAGRRSNK